MFYAIIEPLTEPKVIREVDISHSGFRPHYYFMGERDGYDIDAKRTNKQGLIKDVGCSIYISEDREKVEAFLEGFEQARKIIAELLKEMQ